MDPLHENSISGYRYCPASVKIRVCDILKALSLMTEALIELVLLTQYPSNDSKVIQ